MAGLPLYASVIVAVGDPVGVRLNAAMRQLLVTAKYDSPETQAQTRLISFTKSDTT